jgi:drug/metabolite transporter (DMT)-like permease
VALVRAGHATHGPRRPTYLAAAAGILYGLTAALTKASAHLVDGGLIGIVTSWQPYALVALAITSLVVSQSAFQAGRLSTALPLLIIGEPVVAALIGVLAFHEHIKHTPLALAVELIGACAMAAGVLMLARSPLVLEAAAT